MENNGIKMGKSKFTRIDSDLALNYRLNNYFKVFAGMKYLSYDIVPNNDTTKFGFEKINPHRSCGAGLGVSATIPITGNLFGFATLSGLYLLGNDRFATKDIWYPDDKQNLKIGYNEYGFNSNISIAYYIAQASTVVSLGGRFQYIIANYKGNDISLDYIRFIIYGVTLTATYNFTP
ncbi:MAG: hypothetical protein FWG92_01855 [Leptospirales bacterium]|nr:hypothetical protein [Leptospirales bacterium]